MKPDVISLKNGARIELGTFMTRPLGRVENGSASPLFLFQATPCLECDADPVLYVYSPASKKTEELMFPGKVSVENDILDAGKPALKYDTRVFYGDCSQAYPHSVVIFDKSKGENNVWAESIRVIAAQNDGSMKMLNEPNPKPALDNVLKAAKSKRCREIKGTDRVSF